MKDWQNVPPPGHILQESRAYHVSYNALANLNVYLSFNWLSGWCMTVNRPVFSQLHQRILSGSEWAPLGHSWHGGNQHRQAVCQSARYRQVIAKNLGDSYFQSVRSGFRVHGQTGAARIWLFALIWKQFVGEWPHVCLY